MTNAEQSALNAMGAAWLSAEEQAAFEEAAFRAWMKKVDAYVQGITGGLSADDLPDYCYRDAHDAGQSPIKAARAAVRGAREDGY